MFNICAVIPSRSCDNPVVKKCAARGSCLDAGRTEIGLRQVAVCVCEDWRKSKSSIRTRIHLNITVMRVKVRTAGSFSRCFSRFSISPSAVRLFYAPSLVGLHLGDSTGAAFSRPVRLIDLNKPMGSNFPVSKRVKHWPENARFFVHVFSPTVNSPSGIHRPEFLAYK